MYERWSTLHIDPSRRPGFWEAVAAQSVVPMTARLGKSEDFEAAMVHRGVADLALNEVNAPPHAMSRTRSDLARSGAEFAFLNLDSSSRVRSRQFGMVIDVAPGQLLLTRSDSVSELEQLDDVRLLSLAVPLALVQREVNMDDAAPRVLAHSAAVSLLTSQMRALATWQQDLGSYESSLLADALLGTVRAALSTGKAARPALERQPLPGAALKQLMERHYADPGVSAVHAACQLGMSVRTLHASLARGGRTFGACLLQYRLERAHAMLKVASAQVAIGDVAARCGFASAAHFARRFRQYYGISPGTLRAMR
jgi:AraC-like DNA-binding protein